VNAQVNAGLGGPIDSLFGEESDQLGPAHLYALFRGELFHAGQQNVGRRGFIGADVDGDLGDAFGADRETQGADARHPAIGFANEGGYLIRHRLIFAFELDLPNKPVVALSDRRLLAQAITNLVKNASEAIDSAVEADAARAVKGCIVVKVPTKGARVQTPVIANGCRVPKGNADGRRESGPIKRHPLPAGLASGGNARPKAKF